MARPSRDGRLEKEKKKKKRLTHWDSHWDPAEHSTQSPDENDRGSVCLSVCICVWWVVSLRVLVKAVCMLWCVWWGKLSSAGRHTNIHTCFWVSEQSGWSGGEGGLLCFSSFNKCLMDSPHYVAAVRQGWQSLATDDRHIAGSEDTQKQANNWRQCSPTIMRIHLKTSLFLLTLAFHVKRVFSTIENWFIFFLNPPGSHGVLWMGKPFKSQMYPW